ncbi:UDP-N-acetylglucosamine--undecaprenyl-phosphate N-acetylglucosaminephosphotransferase [Rahnella aquatilis]|uniref:UDP-N-acetylglucosamine--undecaprenyl-phosphate N-acetylglucosaminephosphotransferase n=1 Tax=Rahnella aquatilis TaxID=34038 RepID=UPI000648B3B7|nr:UDP-N-acetylglucosamine--undecaprenyl-phosphate N-acetylglucosaminephosphotransferase [Rahnella aquatilis]
MQEYIIIFFSALASLFIARKVARRVGLVDKPNARKHHSGHIPLVGGVSIYISIWVIYFLQPGWFPDFYYYIVSVSLLLFVGVLDDRFDLPVTPRIVLQAIVAIIMMVSGIRLITLGDIFLGHAIGLGIFGYVITIFAVMSAINAFNMVDGIDGLLGALSCVSFASLGVVFSLHGKEELARWCICLTIACVPYILLNLGIPWGRKFKVFMGDAGSTLIGFTVIWLLVLATQGPTAIIHPVTALWLIAVPLMDMVRVMISRVRRGDSPFKPDREHLHHILLKYGYSHAKSLGIVLIISVSFSVLGIVLDELNISQLAVLILFLVCFGLFVRYINSMRRECIES